MSSLSKVHIAPSVGDIVRYTGSVLSGLTDGYTRQLMKRYLIKGNLYTIKEFVSTVYCIHYRFHEYSASTFCYPSNCFELLLDRERIKTKYNLR